MIPDMKWKIKNVPNHQPAYIYIIIYIYESLHGNVATAQLHDEGHRAQNGHHGEQLLQHLSERHGKSMGRRKFDLTLC